LHGFEIQKLEFYAMARDLPYTLYSLSSDLRHVDHHVTLSPIYNSPVSYLSNTLFLKNPSLSLLFRPQSVSTKAQGEGVRTDV